MTLLMNNVTVVYEIATGEPRMVIVDAVNLNDPAWNPLGHAQLSIDPQVYKNNNMMIGKSAVAKDGTCLLKGSYNFPSVFILKDGSTICLSQIIRNAFDASGLKAHADFCALPDDSRAALIKAQIDILPMQSVVASS